MEATILAEAMSSLTLHNHSPSFADLPAEILVLIASNVGPGDLISLRKVCKSLYNVSNEKLVWYAIYVAQSAAGCIPISVDVLTSHLHTLKASDVESLVLSVYLTDVRWKDPDKASPRPLEASDHPSKATQFSTHNILAMDVLLDRWLVVVHQLEESVVEMWDLSPGSYPPSGYGVGMIWSPYEAPFPQCKIRCIVQNIGPCDSSCVCLDADGSGILVAVTSQSYTKILRFDLQPARHDAVECLATLPTPSPAHSVRAIEPTSRVVAFGQVLSMCFVQWETKQYAQVPTSGQDEELWNGNVGLQFLTPQHILCVKTRSVEIHTLTFAHELQQEIKRTRPVDPNYPNVNFLGERATVVDSHQVTLTLRGASFSQPRRITTPDTDTIETAFLAYDVLFGLYHFGVQVHLPPKGGTGRWFEQTNPAQLVPVDATVKVLGAHRMAQLIPAGASVSGHAPPRSGFTPGSRGFISACALGARGKRGIWIEHYRGTMSRAVFGFSAGGHAPPQTHDEHDEERVASGGESPPGPGNVPENEDESPTESEPPAQGAIVARAPDIAGACLYEVRHSFDLREDLMHCAFSEVTGRVILGTRQGKLYLLSRAATA